MVFLSRPRHHRPHVRREEKCLLISGRAAERNNGWYSERVHLFKSRRASVAPCGQSAEREEVKYIWPGLTVPSILIPFEWPTSHYAWVIRLETDSIFTYRQIEAISSEIVRQQC